MTRRLDRIRGGGGGGGKGGGETASGPREAPDSLRSKQFARVLDLVSEGEVSGLVAGMKSVFLDDTPIQNADNSFNFQDVTLHTRVGTQSQSYIPGFPAVESENSVSVEAFYATPVVRSISNANVTAVRVTLSVPQLSYQNPTTGDLGGDAVGIAIDLQTNGGGYVQMLADTISGKTTTAYQRAYRIELAGSGPWDIRVRRTTADSGESNRINHVFWSSYTEIIDHLLRYPNSALCGVQIDSAQFRNVPRRGYHMKGLKIQVPINYNPETRGYAGNWDGTFKIAYTNNPAWCFYDMLTTSRYGLGEYLDATQIDKWALYTIGQYCDELVDDGFGGTEPRFTCNVYFQTQEEAYTLLQNMASIFRGMVYEAGGYVTAVQDAPADPVMLYTPANVIDGLFTYSGSAIKARHTVALVSWNDPADRYKQKIEYVEDEEGIGRYGVRVTEFSAIGCNSRGQAHRAGKWLLYTERLETDTVTFRTGLDSAYVTPGEIVKIADPNVAGERLGGRILSATTGSVTVDAALAIVAGHSYELSVVLADGTLATRTLNNSAGSASVLTFASALPSAPQALSVWILADIGQVEPQTFRVLGIGEVEKNVYEIVALAHNGGKFALVESGVKLETPPISGIDYRVQAPVGSVTVTKNTEKRQDGTLKVTALIAWGAAIGATGYRVELKRDNDNWLLVDGNTSALISTVELSQEGLYTARVIAFNAIGTPSAATVSSATQIYWVTLSPPNNLSLVTAWAAPDVSVQWDPVDGANTYTLDVLVDLAVVRTVERLVDTRYTYTFADNDADGGPFRTLTFRVKSVGTSQSSAYSTSLIDVTNSQISVAPTPSAAATIHAINAYCTKAPAVDVAGYLFHISATSGFTPSAGNILADGPGNLATAEGLTPGTPYYFRVAAYDVFGQDNVVYSAEFSATPEASVAETASQTIAKINENLSDPLQTDKLVFVADHFAIKKSTGEGYPFAISSVAGVDYVALQADVIINGNLTVANLTSGSLPTDVLFSLGGGTIQLDGAGDIRVYKALGANQDYVSLQAGDIVFKKFISGTGYVDYKNLRRIESGSANSGNTVSIPGYWEQQPKVQVAPALVQFYSPAYAAQGQSVRCEAASLVENPGGSGQWQFTASAQLELSAQTGNTTVNFSGSDQSSDTQTSSTYTTAANCANVTANMRLRSKRGNGASQYFYRQFRTRIDHSSDGTNFTSGTFSAYQDVGAVIDTYINWQQLKTFPSAGTWYFRIVVEWKDKDGSVFGAISYSYSTETLIANAEQSHGVQGLNNTSVVYGRHTINQMPASTVNTTWEIYQINWSWEQSWYLNTPYFAGDGDGYGIGAWAWQHPVGSDSTGSGYELDSYAGTNANGAPISEAYGVRTSVISGSSLAYDRQYLSCYKSAQSQYNGSAYSQPTSVSYYKNISVTIYRRTPIANSTTAVNTFAFDNYNYSLSAAQVLATGMLNWTATGR